jgi:hypothetical protein
MRTIFGFNSSAVGSFDRLRMIAGALSSGTEIFLQPAAVGVENSHDPDADGCSVAFSRATN